MSRSKKGSVSIGADQGFLRLYWRYQGKRYFLPVGLPDTPINRSLAQRKATTIELDILSENFDPTLKRYKTGDNRSSIAVGVLFEQFMEYKSGFLDSRTLEKYRTCLRYVIAVSEYIRTFLNPKTPSPSTDPVIRRSLFPIQVALYFSANHFKYC